MTPLLTLRTARRTALLALVSLGGSAGCGPGTTEPAGQLATARARWERHGPAAYTMTVYRSCSCQPEMSGPVAVSVRSGVVTAARYTLTGAPVTGQYARLFPAVEGLFALVEAGVQHRTRGVDVEYDATLGYPTRIAVGDPRLDDPVYSVTDFRTE